MRRLFLAALAAAFLVPLAAHAREAVAPTKGGVSAPPVTCSLVSYDRPGNRLTVAVRGIHPKRPSFLAAALPKDDGAVWVQAGQVVKADGEVVLEAYEFAGKARVYRAKNPAGRQFLEAAQKGSARQKPSADKALRRAAVEVACEFDVP